ncbi:MAG TPA: hypothetical protein PLO56_12470 [Rhodothermales bacterium]|nr:hypothetical protein [Rhodothermales bacterium]
MIKTCLWTLAFFIPTPTSILAQTNSYAFDTKPVPLFETFSLKRIETGKEAGRLVTFLPALFADDEGGMVQLMEAEINPDSVVHMLTIAKGEEVVFQSFLSDFIPHYAEGVEMVDLNKDGLKDVVLTFATGGNGLAANWRWVLVLLQKVENTFELHRFTNMLPDETYGLFRDMDGDGSFEMVVGSHTNVMDAGSPDVHSYWFFNVFGWQNGKPVNLNPNWNFPLVYRHLDTINRKADPRFSASQKKQFFTLATLPEYVYSDGKVSAPALLKSVFRSQDFRPSEQIKESNRPKSNRPIQNRNLIFFMIGGTGLFIFVAITLLWLKGQRKTTVKDDM